MTDPGQPPQEPGGNEGAATQGWGAPQSSPGWGVPQPEHVPGAPPVGPPAYGQPGHGQQPGYSGPQAPPPSSSYGQYGTGGPQAYAPVPGQFASQPGIIPLRPLTLGEIYDGAIRSIRANPVVMLVLTVVLVTVSVTIEGIATWEFYRNYMTVLEDPNYYADPAATDALRDSLTSTIIGLVLALLVAFIITTALSGLLVHSVSQSVIGRKMSLSDVWTAVRPQLLRLIGLSLVVAFLALLAVGTPVLLIVLAVLTGDALTIAVTGFLVLLLMLAAGITVLTFTVLATPVLVLERTGIVKALRRSFRLARGSFWRILGIYLLTSLIVGTISYLVTMPFVGVAFVLQSPTALAVSNLLGSAVGMILTLPFMSAVVALLYIDVRIRREALDIELARAAESA